MANKIYTLPLDAPATVNKVKSMEVIPDKNKGNGFRIERAWISAPDMDTFATGDKLQFQISTKDQNEAAALYDIDSEYEVYTKALDVQALTTSGSEQIKEDVKKCITINDISGIILKSGKKYYFNHLITGQDGAIGCKLKLLGQYVNKPSSEELEDFHNNSL